MRKSCAFAVLFAGCVADQGFENTRGRPIVGGQAEAGYPAVGRIGTPLRDDPDRMNACTATLIAPRVVVTGLHCIQENTQPGEVTFYTGRVGDQVAGTAVRLFPGGDFRLVDGRIPDEHDILVITLDRAPPIEPAPYRRTAMGQGTVGSATVIVGFGDTALDADSPAEKRMGRTTVAAVQDRTFHTTFNRGEATGCHGDSGGPAFIDGQVTGVYSDFVDLQNACNSGGVSVRLDRYTDLIDQALRTVQQDGGEDGRRAGGGDRQGGDRQGALGRVALDKGATGRAVRARAAIDRAVPGRAATGRAAAAGAG